jgi:hypothetical protein
MTLQERFRDLRDRVPAPVFLITWGRSGSNLLQSFMDGHPEILQIPTIIALHTDWNVHLEGLRHRPAELLDAFFERTSFARDWYRDGLGDSRDQSWDLDRPGLRTRLDRLFEGVAEISKPELLLGLHAAWADLRGLDTRKTRCLLVHHHLVPSRYAELTAGRTVEFDFGEDGEDFRSLEQDFPGCRFICSVRHPMEVFASIQRTMENESLPVDPSRSLLQWWSLLSIPPLLGGEASRSGPRWKFVRFEDLHVSTESVLRDLCGWMGCGWDGHLLESTFDGLAWWGNNPLRPMRGANPEMAKESWTRLPSGLAAAAAERLAEACALLGYPAPELGTGSDAIDRMDLESWLHCRFQDPEDPSRSYALTMEQREEFLVRYWEYREALCGPTRGFHPGDLANLPESVDPFHAEMAPLDQPGQGILHWDLGQDGEAGVANPSASRASTTWTREGTTSPNPYHYWAGWRARFAEFGTVTVSGRPSRHQREILLGAASLGIRVEIHSRGGMEVLPGSGASWPERLSGIHEHLGSAISTLPPERNDEL